MSNRYVRLRLFNDPLVSSANATNMLTIPKYAKTAVYGSRWWYAMTSCVMQSPTYRLLNNLGKRIHIDNVAGFAIRRDPNRASYG